MQRWVPVPVPYSEADAVEYVERAIAGWADGDHAQFTVEYRGEVAGSVGLHHREAAKGPEIGYSIAPAARGQGLATRAARLLLTWGFDEVRLPLVTWTAVVGNRRSRAVAEALGFRIDQAQTTLDLRGQPCPGWVGSLLPDDFAKTVR